MEVNGGVEQSFYIYDVTFEKDGDVKMRIEKFGNENATEGFVNYQVSFIGAWEWTSGKEEVVIKRDGLADVNWKITRLTSSDLWVEFEEEDTYDGVQKRYDIKFFKN